MYRLGLPMWGHKDWVGSFFTRDAKQPDYLRQYTSVFNSVEGNTTFYAIPSEHAVKAWHEAAPDDFRFSFKLPKMITHDLKLQRCDLALSRFFQSVEPLLDRMGPIMVQLPPSFDADHLPILESFIKSLPAALAYAVEVRHLDFFDKAEHELALNALLAKYRIDRVCFDSRGLFASNKDDEANREAQAKKPRLPVHALALSKHPVIRFVGHSNVQENGRYFTDWIEKITQWLAEGREPYLFVHMANNAHAPQLALELHQQLQQALEQLPPLPSWPAVREVQISKTGQMGLF